MSVAENFKIASEKALERRAVNGEKVFATFDDLGTGLASRYLQRWWHERTDPEFGETKASRAFGAALMLSVIIVEADRRTSRELAAMPSDEKWTRDPEWEARVAEVYAQRGQADVPVVWKKTPLQALVSRDPVPGDPELRWHVSVAHMDRVPSWQEFAEAVHELRPGINFCVPMPPRSLWLNYDERVIHAWEVRDEPLIESWRLTARGDTPT